MNEPIGAWYPVGYRLDAMTNIGVDQPDDSTRAMHLLICERCSDFWTGYITKDDEHRSTEIATVMTGHNYRRHGIRAMTATLSAPSD